VLTITKCSHGVDLTQRICLLCGGVGQVAQLETELATLRASADKWCELATKVEAQLALGEAHEARLLEENATLVKALAHERVRNGELRAENDKLRHDAELSDEVNCGVAAENATLREALDMAGHQQHEVARALGLELACDSVYRHYAILETIAVMKRRDASAGELGRE
jgi:hypothetical protein